MSFEYVEMKYIIQKEELFLPARYSIEPINNYTEEELYDLYLEAFLQGDAQFFFTQDKDGRVDYYHSNLGLPEALEQSESHTITFDGELVGFLYCVEQGLSNIHISCMCVSPHYQGQGIGTIMLRYAANEAYRKGIKTMTLGTEMEMKAYSLYKGFGFSITKKDHIK